MTYDKKVLIEYLVKTFEKEVPNHQQSFSNSSNDVVFLDHPRKNRLKAHHQMSLIKNHVILHIVSFVPNEKISYVSF